MSPKRFRGNIRPLTRRACGVSLETMIEKLNLKLRGFYYYFKQGNTIGLKGLDGWMDADAAQKYFEETSGEKTKVAD